MEMSSKLYRGIREQPDRIERWREYLRVR
uniref:Uncharacterized protein n=1 Tax=Nelumbo nucifera TaxID=4432 RepID=A0A822YAC4_NELNU|nr:TPA_asm: hypothetical protein HUJ06_029413 [Nelumbo nucifera]